MACRISGFHQVKDSEEDDYNKEMCSLQRTRFNKSSRVPNRDHQLRGSHSVTPQW